MIRKILALFVLVAFLVFDWSCVAYSTKQLSAPELTTQGTQGMVIEKLLTKSGKIIVFSEERPPVVGRDYVVGVKTGKVKVQKKMQRADVKEFVINSSGRKQAAIMADGLAYWIISMTEDVNGVLTIEYFTDAFAVPISDIESFQVRMVMADTRVDTGRKNRGAIVVVTKKDGDWARGELLAVKRNALVVAAGDTSSGESVSIAIEDIGKVEVIKKSKVGNFMLWGALVGGVLGVAGGLIAGNDSPSGWISFSAEAKAGIGGLYCGFIGFFIGTIVGAAVSANKTFRFENLTKEGRDYALRSLSNYAALKGVK